MLPLFPPSPRRSSAEPRRWSATLQAGIRAVRFVFIASALGAASCIFRDRLDTIWTGVFWAVPICFLLTGYATSNSTVSIRRVAAVSLYLPLGAICAYLAYVEFQVWGEPPSIGKGTVFFAVQVLAMDSLLVLGPEIRAAAATRRWIPRALVLLALVPISTSLAVAFVFRLPVEQPLTRISLAMYVHSELSSTYPYWNWKEATVDSPELWQKYRPRLGAADNACGRSKEPCRPFLRALRDMLAELRNGHTSLAIVGDVGTPPIIVEPIEGRAVVTYVAEGSEAEKLHLVPGVEIVKVDGLPIRDALERVPAWELRRTASHSRTYRAYRAVLNGPPNTRVRIELMDVDRRTARTILLSREPLHYSFEEEGERDSLADVESLGAGTALLNLEGFSGDGLPAELDRLLDKIIKGQGLVLDLRDNPGGRVGTALHFLGRIWSKPLVIGQDCFTSEAGILDLPCEDLVVKPLRTPYEGAIAVMINEGTISAAEVVALSICRTGRGRCFGRPTAGETDFVTHLEIPGGRVSIASALYNPVLGGSIQGLGLQPDVPVTQSLQDVIDGWDPDLEAALSWLRGQTSHPRGCPKEVVTSSHSLEPSEVP